MSDSSGEWPPTHDPFVDQRSHRNSQVGPSADQYFGEQRDIDTSLSGREDTQAQDSWSNNGFPAPDEGDGFDKYDDASEEQISAPALGSPDDMRPLTLGIEFEHLIVSIDNDRGDPFPQFPQPVKKIFGPRETEDTSAVEVSDAIWRGKWVASDVRKICEVLTKYGIPTLSDYADDHADHAASWLIKSDPTVRPPHGYNFKVAENYPNLHIYTWNSYEIVSPPLIYTAAALNAIMRFCSGMTSNFRVHINPTCGLHIHLGLGSEPLPLQAMKRLMTFMWTFDPLIGTFIHEAHRVDNSHYARFCLPIRQPGRITIGNAAHDNSQSPPFFELAPKKLVRTAVGRIMGAKTYEDLYHIIHEDKPSKFLAYNLSGIHGETSRATIEFRAHAGTLDGRRVEAWVKTITGITQFCRRVGVLDFYEHITRQATLEERGVEIGQDGRWNLRQMLQWAGVDNSVADFYETTGYEIVKASQVALQGSTAENPVFSWNDSSSGSEYNADEPDRAHKPSADQSGCKPFQRPAKPTEGRFELWSSSDEDKKGKHKAKITGGTQGEDGDKGKQNTNDSNSDGQFFDVSLDF